MNIFKDNKAQSSLELILIVAGILVLVSIIGYYIKTKVVSMQDNNKILDVVKQTEGK